MPLRSVNRHRRSLSRVNDTPTLSTCHQWFPCGPLLACHLTWSLPGLFLLCSRPWLLTTAAEGGLEPAPASRFRGAYPHRLNSKTALSRPLLHSGLLSAPSWRTVVGITHKVMTAPLQLSVQFVQHQITEQRRKRAALGRALIHRTHQSILHPTGLQKRSNQLEHSFVGHALGYRRHKAVVIHSIEKFFQIEVYHPAVPFGDIPLRLVHRLLRTTPRSKTVAVFGERRVPALLQNLQHRLLDKTVQRGGNA